MYSPRIFFVLPVYVIFCLSLLVFWHCGGAQAGYGVMVASVKKMDDAVLIREELKKKGIEAYIQPIEIPQRGTWNRIIVGPYEEKGMALTAKNRLNSQGYPEAILVITKEQKPSEAHPSKKTKLSKKTENSDQVSLTISWKPSTAQSIKGYNVYYDTDGKEPYSPLAEDFAVQGPPPIFVERGSNSLTLDGLTKKKQYFFAVTAVGENGSESWFSNVMAFPGKNYESFQSMPEQMMPKEPSFKDAADVVNPTSQEQRNTMPPAGKSSDDDYPIFPGDRVSIEIPGQKEMSQVYDVDPDGNIYLVIVGKITIAGLYPSQLQEKILDHVARFMEKGQKPKIEILDRKRYIQIRGGIRYPGWYRLDLKITPQLLVDFAGGLLPGTQLEGMELIRHDETGEIRIPVEGDISLEPNDTVRVPLPEAYQETVDQGDQLFVSIPQRQPPVPQQDRTDSADISDQLRKNQAEVDRNGYIYIPGYGHIYVNGLTTEQIVKAISDRLPKYISRLGQVQVSIIEKRHYIQVLGHVQNPGLYNINETGNIQAALSTAGGAIDGAVMSDVSIKRYIKDNLYNFGVNLYQFTITGDYRLLMPLHENDILFVPISSSFGNVKRKLDVWDPPEEKLEKDTKKKIRIFGAVNNPGMYEPVEDMDLLDLLVMASGETMDAELSQISIIRDGTVDRTFNLTAFLEGKSRLAQKLPKIRSGDTVYVNFVEKREHEAAERIFVIGKVFKPGAYELYENMTVIQALAWAGGLTEWADSDNIMVVRMVNGRQENIPFNFDKAIEGKLPELNIRMQGNDTILVP